MTTLPDAQEQALNEFLNNLLSIQALQATYVAAHSGRPFQGLPSHLRPFPANGASAAPDNVGNDVFPPDQPDSWLDFGWVPTLTFSAIWIDVVCAPAGWTWIYNLGLVYGPDEYHYRLSDGPLDFDMPWSMVRSIVLP